MNDLFDALPYAAPNVRATDPAPSALAAAAIEADGTRQRQARAALALVHRFSGRTALELCQLATDAELAVLGASPRHALGRRLPELRALGLVASPECEQRKCGVCGRVSLTWWPTSSED